MKQLSKSSKVYIIAEIGMNHNGRLDSALSHIEAAALAGVDAVKFQMHISSAEMLGNAPPPPYFKQETRWDYFNRTAFTNKQWRKLIIKAHELKLNFILSPFSEEAVSRCKQLPVGCLKIASGEVNNIFLLNAVKKTKLPVILSSGMSSFKELNNAVNILSKNKRLKAVLQCSSKYPCDPEDVGLNVMVDLKIRYPNIPIGLSDHTVENYASFTAVALGARVIEKHFKLSKKTYGPDTKFSLEPKQMQDLVKGIRSIEEMLNSKVNKNDILAYKEMRNIFCKSIVARQRIRKGEKIICSKLTAKKPGYGLSPTQISLILNKAAKREINEDEIITLKDIKKDE